MDFIKFASVPNRGVAVSCMCVHLGKLYVASGCDIFEYDLPTTPEETLPLQVDVDGILYDESEYGRSPAMGILDEMEEAPEPPASSEAFKGLFSGSMATKTAE